MISKTASHQYYFEVQGNWTTGRKVVLTSNDVNGTITSATAEKFLGGVKEMWSAEHLFLSSLCSCFMTTFLAIAEKKKLGLTHFECNAIGYVSKVDDHLEFTEINVYPKIMVPAGEMFAAAFETVHKTHKYCIVANSLKAKIIYHDAVLMDQHPAEKNVS